MNYRHIKYASILFAAAFFFGGQPVKFGGESAFFHGFAIPQPVVRIGLGVNLSDILIKSSSGMKVYGVHTGYDLLGDDVSEVRVKGEREALTEKFVLLAAQLGRKDEAGRIADRIQLKFGGRVRVDEERGNASGGIYQVKAGEFLTRDEALRGMRALEALGFKDVWILRETLTMSDSRPRWVLIENELKPLNRDAVLYFIPSSPQSFLTYNGRHYRGIFVLKATERGVVLVNVLNVEEYLRGVVPGELSPDVYPEIEALKAQAIAARTYAIKNMGQYRDLGYDLTDTPSSQVYGGMSFERPLSTRAVEETAGQVAEYKGRLINALYTSTCGGRTEDAENMFAGDQVPYLRSVECSYDSQPEYEIANGVTVPEALSGGRDAAPEIAVLSSLGVIPAADPLPDFGQEATFEEAAAWTRGVLAAIGRKTDADAFAPKPEPLSFISLARMTIAAFGWEDRVKHLLLPSEVDFILKDFPQIKEPDRRALAYCIQAGIVPYLAPDRNPGRALTRADVALALGRAFEDVGVPFEQGMFRSAGPAGIELMRTDKDETVTRPLSARPFLVRTLDGTSTAATRLTLLGGEPTRWLERDGSVVFLEARYPSASNGLDRDSRFCRWQVRMSREELQDAINQRHPIGELADVAVRRRGPSGRVTELAIMGSESRTQVRGLQIRWALNVRDTLFTIDREYDPEGRPVSFVFSGRGWGHGVGLCQVGAYGMALAGAKCPDILKKYYRGITIEKIY